MRPSDLIRMGINFERVGRSLYKFEILFDMSTKMLRLGSLV